MIRFRFFEKKCTHSAVMPDMDECYCPDCGAYIKNRWFLTRCACCNVKRETSIKFNKVIPSSLYCPNCGASEFFVEEIDKINFIDINFGVLKKEVIEKPNKIISSTQMWTEYPKKILQIQYNHAL